MAKEKKLEMTPEEIVRSYREAIDKKHQIEVLSDLNVCSKEVIRKVLIENGVKPQELPRQRKKAPAAVAAEVKAYEAERRKELVKEGLRFLRASLQKEYDGVYEKFRRMQEEFESVKAEYLGKINAIDVMLEEDAE